MKSAIVICVTVLCLLQVARAEDANRARAVIDHLLASDPFGLAGAEIVARISLSDKHGAGRQLTFSSKSKRYDPPYAESIVRFSAPTDLAGAAFLQIQKRSGDDDRFLFLPELKRSRRIASGSRSGAFMGTDFSYADLDQRDYRTGTATFKREETIGKWPCDVVDVVPSSDSQYSHVELAVRQDNGLPMRFSMYDTQRALLKTFEALEFKRVSGQWFISKSRITNHQLQHVTELYLEQIRVSGDLPEEAFSLRALEKV
jgi:hypothetical protein